MSAILDMMEQNEIAEALARRISAATRVRCHEPLAGHTTLRVGGPADVYVEPASESDLTEIVKFCAAQAMPFFVLGRGSNLLVRDGGYRGVVICLLSPAFGRIEADGGRLRCGAGAKLRDVAIEARRHNLGGLEFLEGIPGSVGGALRMNAGAMGGATFDVIGSVRLMDAAGHVTELAAGEIPVRYRGCDLLKKRIALGAVFIGRTDSLESIAQRMGAFNRQRWASQPAAPSAGCMFKNPATIPAGKLIDELGLKGTRVGGAVVSAEHGNFIVNDAHATARDVLDLMALVQARVKALRGIELETEVEVIGE
jgi:UDP-N-acetylenolpyruvoylglucosamine reductase